MSEQYYVLLGEEAVGPMSKEALFSMRSDGAVSEQTLVCKVGDSEWTPMGELFPSAKLASIAPSPRPVSSKRSQQDRELLHEYLVTSFPSQKASPYAPSS